MKKKRFYISNKEFSNKDPKSFTLKFMHSLNSESDRGCIIVGTSQIEYLTESLLRKYFSSDPKVIKEAIDPLFEGFGPLSTFASRIKLSYALNLIDDNVYKTLNVIRDIRNVCAHELNIVSFADPFIKEKINNIIIPEDFDSNFEKVINEDLNDDDDNRVLKEIDEEVIKEVIGKLIDNPPIKSDDVEKLVNKNKFMNSLLYVYFEIGFAIKKKT